MGGSRLEDAKKKVIEMIDSLGSRDVAMVIAFSNVADVRQGSSATVASCVKRSARFNLPIVRPISTKPCARLQVWQSRPHNSARDMGDVQVAEAMPATLYVFSDGGFAQPQFSTRQSFLRSTFRSATSKSRTLVFLPSQPSANLEKPEQVEAFARIRNFGRNRLRLRRV